MNESPPLLWVITELSPLASTGGLGEVAGALPPALASRGWNVELLLPLYRQLRGPEVPAGCRSSRQFLLRSQGQDLAARLHTIERFNGCRLHLLEVPELFDRAGIYGHAGREHPDNARRFAALGAVARDWVEQHLPSPCLVHAHDWPAAFAVVELALRRERDRRWSRVRTLFTVHNSAYQGRFPPSQSFELEMGPRPVIDELLSTGTDHCWMRGAWILADGLSTVSGRFARELTKGRWGYGLEAEFRARGSELVGILNGLDEAQWDPRADPHLSASFSPADLGPRALLRRQLEQHYGLEPNRSSAEAPGQGLLLGFVGRLSAQKGIELILDAVPELMQRGVRLVLLGDGDPEFERRLRQLAKAWPGRIAVHIGFDRTLSHRLLAGADAMLLPSIFEPCGLTQMQAMRMGALCIAHAVGGLAETIEDLSRDSERGTGFLFPHPSVQSLLEAVDRARALWAQPDRWRRVQQRAMRCRWSWEAGAREYDRLYRSLLDGPPHALPAALRLVAPGIPRQFAEETAGPGPISGGPLAELLPVGPDSLYAYWDLRTKSSADPSARASAAMQTTPNGGTVPLELVLRRDGRMIQKLDDVPLAGQMWLRAQPGSSYTLEVRCGPLALARSRARQTPSFSPRAVPAFSSLGARQLGSGEL